MAIPKTHKISGTGPEAIEFAKALNLDPGETYKITLNIEANKMVTVTIHKSISNVELKSITEILKKYNLIKKEE